MDKKKLFLIFLTGVFLPVFAGAYWSWGQGGYGNNSSYGYTDILSSILNAIWIIFTALAVIMIVMAGILFLTAQGNPEKLTQARSAFIWGVIGVVVAIAAYSIISIVGSFIGT